MADYLGADAPPAEANTIYCYRAMTTTSTGIWLGDNPFNFALPIVLYHIVIVFIFSRVTHVVLARLGQPIIISQIVAGILLSPSCLGRTLKFEKLLFSRQTLEQLQTVTVMSYTLFYFVLGVKTDLSMIPKVGKKAVSVAVVGTLLPYLSVYLVASALKNRLPSNFAKISLLHYISNKWSLTSYVVVSCFLSELNLLASKVGRLAMSAALIADIIYLLADGCMRTFVLSSRADNPLRGLLGPLSVIGVAGIILLVMRPLVVMIVQRTPEGALLGEASVVSVLLMAFACGFMCMMIGFDFIIGPLLFGMVLPGGAPLGTTLVERVDRFVAGLLTPMVIAHAGMQIDFATMVDVRQWGMLELFLLLTVVSKFVGVILPCIFTTMSRRDVLSLGIIMINKGIQEVGYATQWKVEHKVDTQLFTAVVISIVIICGGTTPMVRRMYRPEDRFVAYMRRNVEHALPNHELGVLACVYQQENVNALLVLLEALGPSINSPICVYLLHLNELVGRTDAVLIPYKRHDKSTSGLSETEHITNAFSLFEKKYSGAVSVLPYVCLSPYSTMHSDLCSLALDKKVSLVIVPFRKHMVAGGNVSFGCTPVHAVNLNVLRCAPCSVGIFVDNGLFDGGPHLHRVAVYFFGGPDDREALALAARMVERSSVELTVVRFFLPRDRWEPGSEELTDNKMLMRFRQASVNGKRVVYREEMVRDSEGTLGVIREVSNDFNLLILGRNAGKESPLTTGLSMWSEYPELGVIGDLLVSTDFGGRVSLLVVQQKGISSSALPYKRTPPSWLKISAPDVDESICKFAKKGLTPSQIGVILRDSHGIAQVKSVTGSKILRILKAHGLAPEIPEDLYHLIKKAVAIRKHLERNRKDKDSKFRLILVESRIHRLARYYKRTKKLPPVWKYESTTASTLVA
ncbi:cation/H(+) antiporter 15-like [Canna indica]|uniref:Cation/H(+) antiporter 15-like n=2 Tax=Mesangiospermae TaxID=1437183 RepID=A0AAQ3JTV5_9LILI|nr:cation/H(+) antiporter 15-like [Canna indica]